MSFTVTFQTYRDCGWIAMFGLANKILSYCTKDLKKNWMEKNSKSLLSIELRRKKNC